MVYRETVTTSAFTVCLRCRALVRMHRPYASILASGRFVLGVHTQNLSFLKAFQECTFRPVHENSSALTQYPTLIKDLYFPSQPIMSHVIQGYSSGDCGSDKNSPISPCRFSMVTTFLQNSRKSSTLSGNNFPAYQYDNHCNCPPVNSDN